MNPYEGRIEREWFVKGTVRGDFHRAESETEARVMADWNPEANSVVLYRDVTYGPLVEVER